MRASFIFWAGLCSFLLAEEGNVDLHEQVFMQTVRKLDIAKRFEHSGQDYPAAKPQLSSDRNSYTGVKYRLVSDGLVRVKVRLDTNEVAQVMAGGAFAALLRGTKEKLPVAAGAPAVDITKASRLVARLCGTFPDNYTLARTRTYTAPYLADESAETQRDACETIWYRTILGIKCRHDKLIVQVDSGTGFLLFYRRDPWVKAPKQTRVSVEKADAIKTAKKAHLAGLAKRRIGRTPTYEWVKADLFITEDYHRHRIRGRTYIESRLCWVVELKEPDGKFVQAPVEIAVDADSGQVLYSYL